MLKLKSLTSLYLMDIKKFTDKWIGENYFIEKDLENILDLSIKDGLNASFLGH